MEILLAERLYITIPLVAVAAVCNLCLFIIIITKSHLRSNWFYRLVLVKAAVNLVHSGVVGPVEIDYSYTDTWTLGQFGCVVAFFVFQIVTYFELLVLIAMMIHLIVQHLQCCKTQPSRVYNTLGLVLLVVTVPASLTFAGVTTHSMKSEALIEQNNTSSMEILLAERLYITIPLVAVAAVCNLCLFIIIVTRRHLRTNWFYWLVMAKSAVNSFNSGVMGPVEIDDAYSKTWELGQFGCVASVFVYQTIMSFELLILIAMMIHLIVQHLQCCKSQVPAVYNKLALILLVVTVAVSLTFASVTTHSMKPEMYEDMFCSYTNVDAHVYTHFVISVITGAIALAMMVTLCIATNRQKSKKVVGKSTAVFLISLVTVSIHDLDVYRARLYLKLPILAYSVDLPSFLKYNLYWAYHANAIFFLILWILDSQIRPQHCCRTSKKPHEPITAEAQPMLNTCLQTAGMS